MGEAVEVVDVDALPSTDEEQPAGAVRVRGADVGEECPDGTADECGRDERLGEGAGSDRSGIKENPSRAEDEAVPNDLDSNIQQTTETANKPANEPSSPRLSSSPRKLHPSVGSMASYGVALANRLKRA